MYSNRIRIALNDKYNYVFEIPTHYNVMCVENNNGSCGIQFVCNSKTETFESMSRRTKWFVTFSMTLYMIHHIETVSWNWKKKQERIWRIIVILVYSYVMLIYFCLYASAHGKPGERAANSRRDFINLLSRLITCAVRWGPTRVCTSLTQPYSHGWKRARRESTWVYKPDGHPR